MKSKGITALVVYLLIFAALFGLSAYDYFHGIALIAIGYPAGSANMIILILSSLSILKTAWHIYSY